MDEDRDPETLRGLPHRIESLVVEPSGQKRRDQLVAAEAERSHRALQLRRGVGPERIVVREAGEPVRMRRDDFRQPLVAAARHEDDAHEAVPVDFRGPPPRHLVVRPRRFGIGKAPRPAPGPLVVAEPAGDNLPLRLAVAGDVGLARRVASVAHRKVRVAVEHGDTAGHGS